MHIICTETSFFNTVFIIFILSGYFIYPSKKYTPDSLCVELRCGFLSEMLLISFRIISFPFSVSEDILKNMGK